jgi:hypothetical protein
MAGRSITLEGANTIFGVAEIQITRNSELGYYESSGRVQLQNKTLTGLCQEILKQLTNKSA